MKRREADQLLICLKLSHGNHITQPRYGCLGPCVCLGADTGPRLLCPDTWRFLRMYTLQYIYTIFVTSFMTVSLEISCSKVSSLSWPCCPGDISIMHPTINSWQ